MTRPRAEIFASRARRLASEARRFAILAAYERGEKAEAIAAEYSVTVRLVRLHAAQAGISRPRGRPRKVA